MHSSIGMLAFACTLIAGHARAEWVSKVDEPDIFGNTQAFAVTVGEDSGLVVRCNADELKLAWTMKKKPDEDVPLIHMKLLVQVDGGKPASLDAAFQEWNTNYAGVIAAGRNADIVAVLRTIGAAQKSIKVGAMAGEKKMGASFDAENSTAAINAVIKACHLDNIKPDMP